MTLALQPEISAVEYLSSLRQDLTAFITRTYFELNPDDELLWNWHIDVLASKLADAASGKIKRLIITAPPRQMKSIAASAALPAWILGRKPNAKILCASYGQQLSDDLAGKCLTVMNSSWYKATFSTRLAANRRALNDFHTTGRGFRRSASVGGALTGFGADFIIIDDARKSDEAESDVQREAANTWFDGTVLSRLNSKVHGCIIIVMQRLHPFDLVGHVLASGEKWDILNLPAIAPSEEAYAWSGPLGAGSYVRGEGEALHPAREPLSVLEGLRRQMGSYTFEAHYNQNPLARSGARIDISWFQRYDPSTPIKYDYKLQSWDTANKAGELNDYSVCTTWGVAGQKIYLLHVYRARLLFPDLEKKVVELAENFEAAQVIVEDHASGTQLIQNLPTKGFHKIKAFKPLGEKAMRMETHTGMIEFGRVFLPREAGWLQTYLDELQSFPNSRHKDQVDSTSQALEWINTNGRESGVFGFYRQEAERMSRAAAPPGMIRLRAPGVGGELQLNGMLHPIRPDADGIFNCPADRLDNLALSSLLYKGWSRVDPEPPPPEPKPSPPQWVLQAPYSCTDQYFYEGKFVGPDEKGRIRTAPNHALDLMRRFGYRRVV